MGIFKNKDNRVVEFEDTEWMINSLEGINKDLKFTVIPDGGHGIHWYVYPKQELYDWFLLHDKSKINRNNGL